MNCPNCGYCPHCGRSAYPDRFPSPGDSWPNRYPYPCPTDKEYLAQLEKLRELMKK